MPSLPHLHVFCADIIPFLGGKIAVLPLGLPSWLGFCPLSNSKNKKSSISEVPGEIPGPVLIGTDYVPLSSPITKILISLTLASPIHPLLHSVQFSSVAQSCPTLCNPMDCSTPGSLSITNSQSLLKLMSIESVMPSNYLIFCRPLLLLPSIFPSIRVFSNESALRIRWPKYWSYSFNISPSNEYPRLISFRMDWLNLLAVQGHSRIFSNTTVQKHQFFGTQLSL